MSDNRYTPPESDIRVNSAPNTKAPFIRKFLYSFAACFIPLVAISISVLSSAVIKPVLIGSFTASLFGGIVGGLIPSNKKWLYISISVALVWLGMWALGNVGR